MMKDLKFAESVGYRDSVDLLHRLRPATPVYLYCEEILRQQVETFQAGFPGEVSYAVKANPHRDILRGVYAQGVRSFDVASLNEISLVRELFPTATLHYNNPVKSTDMVEQAYGRFGVRSFTLDDTAGLDQLIPYASGEVEATVRFKLDHASAAYDFGSKFGATPARCAELLGSVAARGFKPSLTFHPGSQCTDEMVYREYILAAARIAARAGVTLHRLNVGGGFPVAYRDTDINPLAAYFRVIAQVIAETTPEFGQRPQLVCEPGRALVAGCTSLVTQVIHRRENGAVFINDGVYGGLQEQFVSNIRLPLRVWRAGALVTTATTSTRVFGPTCDPTDRLPVKLNLPVDIVAGDWIEFGLMGAYGSATATRFNGFHSADYYPVEVGFAV